MKSLLIVLIIFFSFQASLSASGYSIKVNAKGWEDSTLILGHYFNKKLLVNDTIILDKKGSGTLTGTKQLPGGIYFLFMPSKEVLDIMVSDDQMFEISFSKPNHLQSCVIKGAKESEMFCSYQQFISKMQQEVNPIRERLEKNKNNVDSVNHIKPQLEAIDAKVKEYWNKAIAENPNTFYAAFLKGIQEVQVPEPFVPFNEAKRDSIIQWRRYQYYKEHAFDNVNLSDPRLYLTPFLAQKIETFLTQTIFQIPDSVLKESVNLIERSKGDSISFKYMLSQLFNLANESKQMGMDRVVVGLGETYYLSGQAPWADKEFLTKLDERVSKMKPNLVGNIAPELKLQTVDGEFHRLSEIKAPYTILVFFEPECGHCKKEIPKLNIDIWQKYKSKGIKIMCVYTQLKPEPWTEFVQEHALHEWINVYDPYNLSNYRNLYDVYSTPVIYILDKDKRIVAKRIAVEDIAGFLDHYLK